MNERVFFFVCFFIFKSFQYDLWSVEKPYCAYLCVCPQDDLKTIAYICFLLGSYIDWRKIVGLFVADQGQGQFLVG